MFVLAHLSDPHLAPLPKIRPFELASKRGLGFLNWLRRRRSVHRAEVLATLVADLKARAPDHVAVVGDLVNLSLSTEFAPARTWLEKLGGPADVTLVPGNHDAYVRAAADLAQRHWGEFMAGDDGGGGFPFVRRRGPLALIGLSTALPTLPLAATGRLHSDQLARLDPLLGELEREGLCRVLLIHHPPIAGVNHFRRLVDAAPLRELLRRRGAELVLHGHLHRDSLVWLPGPHSRIPVIGVPSASGAPGRGDDPAGYNLYEIDGAPGAWRCTMAVRGLHDDGPGIDELRRQPLFG
jgi:3',5'-cyclic AMP phosphodiesterase CpdA